MDIGKANSHEAEILTQIAFASKAHWGYPNNWLEEWRKEIEITPESIETDLVFKAVDAKGKIMGFYRLSGSGKKRLLTGFWVLPEFMGKGVGRALFEHLIKEAKKQHVHVLEWESDPHSTTFYEAMGAKIVNERSYMLDGQKRTLPIMQVVLNAT